MKVVDRKMVSYNPVIGEWETTIEATWEEIAEFNKALNVVNRFKDLAMAEHKIREENADWTMFNYNQEENKMIVTIKQGMCG